MVLVLSTETRSGSIGSTVYSHNKGGAYARQRKIPTNPNSERQQQIRTKLQLAASNWSALTTGNRELWNAYAADNPILNRLGQSITLTGIAMYIRLCVNVLDWGGALLTTPPVEAAPDPLIDFEAAAGATPASVVFTYTTAIGGGERIQAWQTLPHLANSSPNFNQAFWFAWSPAGQATGWEPDLKVSIPLGQYATAFARVFAGNGSWSVAATDFWLSA